MYRLPALLARISSAPTRISNRPHMSDALNTLRQALAGLRPHLGVGSAVPAMKTEKQDLAVLSTALFRKAYVQAAAVAAIAASDSPESALPNLRCMLEAWGELHHLMSSPDPVRAAQIAHLYALRELQGACQAVRGARRG